MPEPTPTRRRRQRGAWRERRVGDLLLVLLTCGVVALAIAVLTGSIGPLRSSPTDRPAGERAYQLRPPAALPAVGALQTTVVGRRGVVRVTQWVRSEVPLHSVDLAPATASSRATGLVVAADGSRTPGTSTVGSTGLHLAFSQPATTVYLAYRLSGVVDRRSSVKGRALVRATALRVTYADRTGPTVVRVKAPAISALACTEPSASGGADRTYPCGEPTASGWRVVLTKKHRDASVSAQVELR